MGAFFLSRILPGGGAAGSIFAAKAIVAHGNPVPRTVASMLISWWVSMTTLALVVGVGTASGLPERSTRPTSSDRQWSSVSRGSRYRGGRLLRAHVFVPVLPEG